MEPSGQQLRRTHVDIASKEFPNSYTSDWKNTTDNQLNNHTVVLSNFQLSCTKSKTFQNFHAILIGQTIVQKQFTSLCQQPSIMLEHLQKLEYQILTTSWFKSYFTQQTMLLEVTWHNSSSELSSQCGHHQTCPLTDLWYNGVRLCFLLPGWGWQDMEAERGIDMGAVEVDRPEPVLRATGGSEEPLSISDTGDRTLICCWNEGTALKSDINTLTF